VLNNTTLTPASAVARDWAVEPYAGLAATQHMSAPMFAAQGTGLSASGKTVVRSSARIDGLDVTATPGSPPREAPV
jgi:hypothetical protein